MRIFSLGRKLLDIIQAEYLNQHSILARNGLNSRWKPEIGMRFRMIFCHACPCMHEYLRVKLRILREVVDNSSQGWRVRGRGVNDYNPRVSALSAFYPILHKRSET